MNKKIISEINDIKRIMNYLLNENMIAKNIIVGAIKGVIDDVVVNAIKGLGDDVIKQMAKQAPKDIPKELFKQGKVDLQALTKKALESAAKAGKKTVQELDDVTKATIERTFYEMFEEGSDVADDIVKKVVDASKKTVSASKTSTSTVADENSKAVQVFVRNNADDIAKIKSSLPETGKNITTSNKKFFFDFFGRAKLITDVGGKKFITRKNLIIAAAALGITYSILQSDLESEGVTVQDDSVGAGSGFDGEFACAKKYGEPIPLQYFPGKSIVVYESKLGNIITYYYNTGVYFSEYKTEDNKTLKSPKGKNEFYRFYCEGNNVKVTKDIVNLDGKPINANTGESGQTQPGSQYSGPRKWRSLGPKYNAEIKAALGKSGTDLTDEDIKDIYDRLNKAGKIKN
jgi:hypothetical protein